MSDMRYHGKFSFPNTISLLSLRGDGQPPGHTYFNYVNKPEIIPVFLISQRMDYFFPGSCVTSTYP